MIEWAAVSASGAAAVVRNSSSERAGSEGRERPFTAYVRHLDEHGEPDPDAFDRVLRALAGALRAELRRRGLWISPPSFVGVSGFAHWNEEGALDELTAVAYQFSFVTRLRSLIAQSRTRANVEGLVFRNVKNLVHERQRAADPLGYLAWERLHAAVETALADGRLHVVDGAGAGGGDLGGDFSGDSLLAGDPADDPWGATDGDPARRRQALDALTAQWNAELLPDLVTGRGKRRDEVVAELARRLPEFVDEGLAPVSFRHLLAAMRRDLRQRWAAMFWEARGGLAAAEETGGDGEEGDGGFTRVLVLYHPPLPPEEQVAEQQQARRLTDCVTRAVESEPGDPRTLGYLGTLWAFIRACTAADEQPPSQRKVSTALGIPRERLPGLYERLGEMLQRCRRLLRGLAGKGER